MASPISPSLPSSLPSITSTSSSTQVSSSQSSSSSTSSSTSSSSSSSLSSSSVSSSTTSSVLTPTTSTSRTTSRPSSTPGNVVTSTSTLYTTPSRGIVTPTSTLADGGSTPFLKNKGAVAAVFILVGLVCLGIIVFLARNFQRRRRHEAFDRELQEATRQAAATSTGPFFDDDDDGPYKNSNGATQASMYGSAERQFSDASHGTQGTHGTYSQPPLAVDSYGMREISHPPGPGDMLYSSDPYAAGAAGIGVVRARSMRTDGRKPDFASALKDGNGPYPAFAIPNPAHMPGGGGDPYASTKNMVTRRGSAGYSQHPYAQQQHVTPVRHKSFDGAGQQNHTNGQGPGPNNRYSVVNEETEDAYGGVEDGVDDHHLDPHMGAPFPNPHLSQDSYANGSAHNEVGEPRRVLKVANE